MLRFGLTVTVLAGIAILAGCVLSEDGTPSWPLTVVLVLAVLVGESLRLWMRRKPPREP